MHIKRFTASIDKDYLSIYKELQIIESAKKGLLNDYLKKLSLPYHAYRISNQKLLSQIFSVTKVVCTHQISLQYLKHHLSAQSVANPMRAIQKLLKKVQFLSRETIIHRR